MSGGRNKRESQNQRTGSSPIARAVTLHIEGKGRDALREIDRALESGEPPKLVFAARGQIQFELELYPDAARSYEALVEIEPDSPTALFNLAVCQEKLALWTQAASNFERVLAIDPDRHDARLGLGICLLNAEQGERAL